MYEKKHLAPLLGIAVVVAGIIAAIGLGIDWLPTSITPEGDRVDHMLWWLFWASGFFFTIVISVLVYSVWKFRRKPGDDTDGPPIHGNTKLEVVWTVVPVIVLIASAVWAIVIVNGNEADAANQYEIHANGEQFVWRFDYTDPTNHSRSFRTGDLHVPVDRQVKLRLTSSDVIHDFWVPDIRIKQDAVPGINTYLRFTPDRTGTYPVVCAALCGAGHALMRTRMIVQTQAQFDAWERQAAAQAYPSK